MSTENRRPLSSRNHRWAQAFAHYLAVKKRPTPNQISCLAMVFAALGALLLAYGAHPVAWVLAALMIQLRLLCNLFDGMVAIEGGLKTPSGDLYNELPDRVADSVLLIALGHAAGWDWLGWLAALLAMATAYIRVFGGSLGFAQSFRGPMAKQHRMAVLTVACLLGVWADFYEHSLRVWQLALLLIVAGSALTCWLRIRDIARLLQHRAAADTSDNTAP